MQMSPNEVVAAEIRAEMARRQCRQADLTQVLGVSQSGVSARLAGRIPLSVTDLVLIAHWLEIDPARLLSPLAPVRESA